ncbi:hypothetical protein DYH09_26740 [bacterium CPR1]|nr:hypothetical protein [bacterium CPR1]
MNIAISFLRSLNPAQRQARGGRPVHRADTFECRGWGYAAPRVKPPSRWRLLRAALMGSTLSAIPLVGAVPLGMLMEGPESKVTGVSRAMLAGAALNISCSVAAVFVGLGHWRCQPWSVVTWVFATASNCHCDQLE